MTPTPHKKVSSCCGKCYFPWFGDEDNGESGRCVDRDCLCHKICENGCGHVFPYGFVPEADCPVHDAPEPSPTKSVESWEEKYQRCLALAAEGARQISEERTIVNDLKSWRDEFAEKFAIKADGDGFGWSSQDMDGYRQVISFIKNLLEQSLTAQNEELVRVVEEMMKTVPSEIQCRFHQNCAYCQGRTDVSYHDALSDFLQVLQELKK